MKYVTELDDAVYCFNPLNQVFNLNEQKNKMISKAVNGGFNPLNQVFNLNKARRENLLVNGVF